MVFATLYIILAPHWCLMETYIWLQPITIQITGASDFPIRRYSWQESVNSDL